MAFATIIVKPAAGPETDNSEPESKETTIPPTIPARTPAIKGAPDAKAMPKHNGKATKNTAIPDFQSPETRDL
jgi:hypothetical protein